jgi:hypothetical protein
MGQVVSPGSSDLLGAAAPPRNGVASYDTGIREVGAMRRFVVLVGLIGLGVLAGFALRLLLPRSRG